MKRPKKICNKLLLYSCRYRRKHNVSWKKNKLINSFWFNCVIIILTLWFFLTSHNQIHQSVPGEYLMSRILEACCLTWTPHKIRRTQTIMFPPWKTRISFQGKHEKKVLLSFYPVGLFYIPEFDFKRFLSYTTWTKISLEEKLYSWIVLKMLS